MSYGEFSAHLAVKTIDTGENPMLGGFKTLNNIELGYIYLHCYINDLLPTTETMKLEIHSTEDGDSLLFSSNTINVSEVENLAANVIFKVRFDFSRQNINKNYYYYPKLIIGNYVRPSLTEYFSMVVDWPVGTNTIATTAINLKPMKYEVLEYRV